jgi:hypothetical protein
MLQTVPDLRDFARGLAEVESDAGVGSGRRAPGRWPDSVFALEFQGLWGLSWGLGRASFLWWCWGKWPRLVFPWQLAPQGQA